LDLQQVTSSNNLHSKEQRALKFFYYKASPALSEHFHHEFRRNGVLRFAIDEPAVRHAAVALSSMFEIFGQKYELKEPPVSA
jgi:hypothetical protein